MIPAIGIPASDLLGAFITPRYSAALFAALQAYVGIAFFGILVMSYVIGQMLFRCDPKYPDFASIEARPEGEIKGSCVGEFNEESAQFPYGLLQDFLRQRNFDHLIRYVTWSKEDFEKRTGDWKHRSKHLINKFKLSIKLHNPRIYFEISRNETHVRLMSSLWYLMRTVIVLASVGLSAGLLSIAYYSDVLTRPATAWNRSGWIVHGEAALYPAATLLLAIVLQKRIEKYFHYQRVREIVYVLEAWYLIDPERHARGRRKPASKALPPTLPAPEAAR